MYMYNKKIQVFINPVTNQNNAKSHLNVKDI